MAVARVAYGEESEASFSEKSAGRYKSIRSRTRTPRAPAILMISPKLEKAVEKGLMLWQLGLV